MGRPPGTKAAVLSAHGVLRHHHFSYVRYVTEGVSLRESWRRCLAFAGDTDDARYFARRLREICTQIEVGAAARNLSDVAALALQGLARHWERDASPEGTLPASGADADVPADSVAPSSPDGTSMPAALPTLDEWVAERCAELNIEADFQTQAEWLLEYQAEFALDMQVRAAQHDGEAQPVAWRANAMPHEDRDSGVQRGHAGVAHPQEGAETTLAMAASASLPERLKALNRLTTWLAVPPALGDAVEAWLAPALSVRLREVGIATLANLADYVDVHGHRWHRRVRALGAVRAARLLDWLAPIAAELGRPMRETSLKPAHQVALARQHQLAVLDPLRLKRFGIVPLERLAVPPELSGRQGTFRVQGPNTLGAEDDLAAIQAWLQRYTPSPRTYRSYFHAVEAFYLWCVWARRKPLSSLVESDLHAFREFISAPPADWVQTRGVDRANDSWRPFRGALSPQSQRHVFSVVGALYRGLVDAGYLAVHAVSGVKPHLALPRATMDVRRSFSEAQWACVLATLASLPDTGYTRRMRLVLEIGATTGLRLIEICTARMANLRQEVVNGQSVWLLHVVGKGRRERDVVVFDDVKSMLDRHQLDMAEAGVGFDPRAPLRELRPTSTLTPNTVALSVDPQQEPQYDPGKRPLVGALRRPVPRWRLGANGVAELQHEVAQGDAYGAIEPSALYQALKRLLARAAERASLSEPPLDEAAFRKASTHWLRHFFANNAIDDGVKAVVLRDLMGHADLRTSSLYLRAEQRALVEEMAKMRRRG